MKLFKWILSITLIGLVKCYQYTLSPLLMMSCRFTPSCSQYAVEAIKKHGPFRGGWLSLKRFFSCHPWGKHGHDPVP